MNEKQIELLQGFISDNTDPVFILDNEQRVLLLNYSAYSGCKSPTPKGKYFRDLVVFGDEFEGGQPVLFKNQWLNAKQKQFTWHNSLYHRVILKNFKTLLDPAIIPVIKNMIAVLVHRMRSSLTGMQGYLDLLETDLLQNLHDHKISRINDGMKQLFNVMDEMETLHNISSHVNDTRNTFLSNPADIIDDILSGYSSEIQPKFDVDYPSGKHRQHYNCNPVYLKRILGNLIQNAVEHSRKDSQRIKIIFSPPESIEISNGGRPIPEPVVSNLFCPFVTTKANSLGIGLTIAQLVAYKAQACIFLTGNNSESGITFKVFLPPLNNSSL